MSFQKVLYLCNGDIILPNGHCQSINLLTTRNLIDWLDLIGQFAIFLEPALLLSLISKLTSDEACKGVLI